MSRLAVTMFLLGAIVGYEAAQRVVHEADQAQVKGYGCPASCLP